MSRSLPAKPVRPGQGTLQCPARPARPRKGTAGRNVGQAASVRARGARGTNFARGRGARGAGQRPRAPLPTLATGPLGRPEEGARAPLGGCPAQGGRAQRNWGGTIRRRGAPRDGRVAPTAAAKWTIGQGQRTVPPAPAGAVWPPALLAVMRTAGGEQHQGWQGRGEPKLTFIAVKNNFKIPILTNNRAGQGP